MSGLKKYIIIGSILIAAYLVAQYFKPKPTNWSPTYLAEDKKFGAFWKMLHAEFELSKSMLLKLAGHESLMENYPVEKRSIAVREKIILPLVLVQHYALEKLQHELTDEIRQAYEKLAIRTVYGIVNAGRNLA